jgi:hypothetical protein
MALPEARLQSGLQSDQAPQSGIMANGSDATAVDSRGRYVRPVGMVLNGHQQYQGLNFRTAPPLPKSLDAVCRA